MSVSIVGAFCQENTDMKNKRPGTGLCGARGIIIDRGEQAIKIGNKMNSSIGE